jgi:long-chain fatty acid transport protein
MENRFAKDHSGEGRLGKDRLGRDRRGLALRTPLRRALLWGLAGSAVLAARAQATDGYFADGYGIFADGRGGTAYAIAEDAMGGANNPATMAFVGTRVDLGLSLFMPSRSATQSGNLFGLNGSATSRDDDFVIPELGANYVLSPDWTLGVTVYGNGGMDTDYPGGQINCGHGPANLLCGSGNLGVNLNQLVIAPTVTYKITPTMAIGFAPELAYQWFEAYGLQAFTPLSVNPAHVTNNGFSYSEGGGFRIGWMWEATDKLNLGVTYQSPLWMTRFEGYSGLFAGGGSFDIPQNAGAGIAYQITPKLLFAFDYEWINYNGVNSIGLPSTSRAPLGSANGPGFGWQNVNVFKVGFEYKPVSTLILRAGYNHGDNPILARDVTFNILAPGVVQDHVTVGATWDFLPGYELSFAYMHAFQNTVTGPVSPLFPGGGIDTIRLSENEVGLEFSIKW